MYINFPLKSDIYIINKTKKILIRLYKGIDIYQFFRFLVNINAFPIFS